MREKLLHFPCVSRIHSTSERKNPPDFRWEGAKCELATILFIVLRTISIGFGGAPTTLVVPMIADVSDYETAKSGRYVAGMFGTIFSFVDQLVSSLAPVIVGLVVAAIGFGEVFPSPNDALTTPLFAATLVLAFGVPAFCLLISIITMHFYKLDRKTMEDLQAKISEAKVKGGNQITAS